MAEYIEYHPLKFWLDPASIAEIVAHIQTYLVNNPINSTTEIETIIHDYLIAHPELIGGVDSVNGLTGEVVLTADNISGGENVTIADVLDSLQDQIDDIVASIPSDYQQLINDVSDLKSAVSNGYTPNWVDGKKVNSLSGNLINDANSSITKLDVAPLMRIKGFTRANGAYSGIAFYTIDDKFISGFSNSGSTYNWNFELIAPQNAAYALISCSTAYKNNFYCNYYNITPSTINTSNELLKQPKTFYCGATRELATLKAGIEEATKYMDSVLYVDAGTYDLIEEFGNDYFENLTSANQLAGLRLKNRIHVIFSPNSKVVSHYTGSNQYAKSLYSPFNVAEYGFTLENLTLECSNCRYAVHDERNGGTEQYKSEYINCNLYIDNSANEYWGNSTCIGGGLGSNAEIIIKDCIFKGVNDEARFGVYYHQSNKASDTNYKSKVIINGNFFVTGCVQIDDARTDSTGNGKTDYIVTNNSFPVKYAGTDDEGIYDVNMTNPESVLYAWNNKIRSA